MIVSIGEVKGFLKIEPEDTEQDSTLQILISAAEDYLKNATEVDFDDSNGLAKLFCFLLITDWYENPQYVGKTTDKTKGTVKSMLMQLRYCYPKEGEVP